MNDTEFNGISFDLPKGQSNVIKVIGVGGGGSNAVNHMYSQGIKGVDFVVCNTDVQALRNSPIPHKIQLGASLTEGLGAGANPEVGEQSAVESIEEIKTMLSTNAKMIFITVGMGGGTGTGAAPIIAKLAREMDLLTIGIVTMPFIFEGNIRNKQAQAGIETLRSYVDSLVVINNNKLREVYGNLGFKAGFSKADEVLSTAARGIAEVITHHYTQNIDLKDAKTVLSNSGTAIMGSATASGTSRAQEAIFKALDSPLLNDNKITGARNVLLLIVSGSNEITIDEIGEINDFIQSEAQTSVNIIMGVGEDQGLGDEISVTVIATGFNQDQQKDISYSEPKKIVHRLDAFSDNPKQSELKKQSIADQDIEPEKAFDNKSKDINSKEEISSYDKLENIEIEQNEIDENKIATFVNSNYKEKENVNYPKEHQTSLTFDLPVSSTNVDNDKGKSLSTDREPDDLIIKGAKINNLESSELLKQPSTNNSAVYFNLEDEEQPSESSRLNKINKVQEQEDPFEFNVRTVYEDTDNNSPNISLSPIDSTISELKLRVSERKEKMKDFNYKFINKMNNNIDEIEKEPAYKRKGVDLKAVDEDSNGDNASGVFE